MARPRSDERREAIMAAATRIIAAQGLSAPTAMIAKEAQVSNGSLFTYFETKAELLNQLYVELKLEMATATLDGLPDADARARMLHIWSRWLQWAASYPEKRRTLAHLGVSNDITDESHQKVGRSQADLMAILQRAQEHGPMRDAPLMFVASLMNALAEATIGFIIRDPANADAHATAGFEALWRMVA